MERGYQTVSTGEGQDHKVLKKYSKLSITWALEMAKQGLTLLAAGLKMYTRDVEAGKINRTFSTEPSKVNSKWEGKKIRTITYNTILIT